MPMSEATQAKINILKDATNSIIDFTDEELGDDGARALAEVLTGKQIQSLILNGCSITNEGFQSLVPVINASQDLELLDLGKQDLDISLLTVTKIKTLRLNSCQIDEQKWPKLVALVSRNRMLVNLVLDQNPIPGEKLKDLLSRNYEYLSLAECNLELLNQCDALYRNEVNKKGSIHIHGNKFDDVSWQFGVTGYQNNSRFGKLEVQTNTLRGQVNSHEQLMTKQTSDLAQLKKDQEEALQVQNEKQAADLAQLKKDHETALQVQTEKQTADLQQLKKDFEAALQKQNEKHNTDIEQLKKDHDFALQAQKKIQKEKIQKLNKKQTDDRAKHIKELKELRIEFKNKIQLTQQTDIILKERINVLETEVSELKAGVKTLRQIAADDLIEALKNGDIHQAEVSLELGANLEARDVITGETPLSLALSLDNFEVAQKIIEKDIKAFTYTNRKGETPLEQAAKQETTSTFSWIWQETKKIISSEAKEVEFAKLYQLATTENKKYLALDKLWESVKPGNLAAIKSIFDQNELNMDVDILQSESKETLLYLAVYYEHVEIIRYLLEKGANFEVKNHVFELPPIEEKKQNETEEEYAKRVAEHAGKEEEYKNKIETAFELACRRNVSNVLSVMASHVLSQYIKNDNFAGMLEVLNIAKSLLIQPSRLLEEKDFDGQTALHLAALKGSESYLAELLTQLPDNDALLNVKNADGKTALHLAVEQQQETSVLLLLKKGASVAVQDNDGQVALHKAVLSFNNNNKSSINIVKNILKTHALVKLPISDFQDTAGLTPQKLASLQEDQILFEAMGPYYGKCKVKSNVELSYSVSISGIPSTLFAPRASTAASMIQQNVDSPEHVRPNIKDEIPNSLRQSKTM